MEEENLSEGQTENEESKDNYTNEEKALNITASQMSEHLGKL